MASKKTASKGAQKLSNKPGGAETMGAGGKRKPNTRSTASAADLTPRVPVGPATQIDLETHDAAHTQHAVRVVEMLEAIHAAIPAEQLSAQSCGEFIHIDGKRTGKTILIDGPRGVGKTTLLLLVIRRLIARLSEASVEIPAIHAVGLLDLEILSSAVPIPVHVLIRLRDLFQASPDHDVASRDRSRSSNQARLPLPGNSDLEDAWTNAAEAVTRGWHSNLKERRESLEPSDYHWAVETAARQNREYGDAFRRFMDQLVAHYRAGVGGHGASTALQPLFVICIDDADMQPKLSIELIESVRKLWHPNLAFLLAGDETLFVRTLQSHYEAGTKDATMARELAHEAFDKSVHYQRRIGLGEHSVHERWTTFRHDLGERGLSLSPDAQRVFTLAPDLSRAIPASRRQRNRILDELRELMPQGSAGVVNVTILGSVLWFAATQRESPPHGVPAPASSRDTDISLLDISFPLEFQTLSDMSIPNLTRGTVSIPHGEDWETWPPGPRDRLSASFCLWLYGCICARRPTYRFPEIDPRVRWRVSVDVRTAMRESYRSDSKEDGELSIDWAPVLHPRQLLSLHTALRGKSRRGQRFAAQAIVLLSKQTSGTPWGDDAWDDTWNRAIADGRFRNDRSVIIAAVLLALPESGLRPKDANSLLDEVLNQSTDIDDEIRSEIVELRENRMWLDDEPVAPSEARQWLARLDKQVATHRASDILRGKSYEPFTARAEEARQWFPSYEVGLSDNQSWSVASQGGLQKYVSDARARALLAGITRSHETRKQVEAMRNRTSQLGWKRRAGYLALRELWQSVGGDEDEFAFGRNYVKRGVTGEHANLVKKLVLGDTFSLPTPRDGSALLGIRERQSPAQARDSNLPRDIVRRIITDVAVDTRDDSAPRIRPMRTDWSVSVETHDVQIRSRWPGVQAVAPIDAELLDEGWNLIVQDAKSMSSVWPSVAREPDEWLLDQVAMNFILLVLGVGESRSIPRDHSYDIEDPRVRAEDLGRRMRVDHGLLKGDSSHARSFKPFLLWGIPILCFPEHGLSSYSANALLSAWLGDRLRLSQGEANELRQQRLNFVEPLNKRASVARRLAELDERCEEWKAVGFLRIAK